MRIGQMPSHIKRGSRQQRCPYVTCNGKEKKWLQPDSQLLFPRLIKATAIMCSVINRFQTMLQLPLVQSSVKLLRPSLYSPRIHRSIERQIILITSRSRLNNNKFFTIALGENENHRWSFVLKQPVPVSVQNHHKNLFCATLNFLS